ncbi:hypothetical protein HBB16_04945 [Pseudonocardia sp. MCCB 268]|nr:hypothetical protein [Pseudonocardia cytotoxica]
MLYSRIRDTGRFDPVGDTCRGPHRRRRVEQVPSTLAETADQRARQLGTGARRPAAQRWATDASALSPEAGPDREAWITTAGRGSLPTEMRDHDDPADAPDQPPAARPGRAVRRAPRCLAGPRTPGHRPRAP